MHHSKGGFTIYVTCRSASDIVRLYIRIDLSSIPMTLLPRDASAFTYNVNPPSNQPVFWTVLNKEHPLVVTFHLLLRFRKLLYSQFGNAAGDAAIYIYMNIL